MKKVLCFLTVNPQYIQFGIPQLKSLLLQSNIPAQILFSQQLKNKQISHSYEINYKMFNHFPFVVLKVPDFEKHRQFFERMCKEAVMIYKVVLLIGQGDTYEEMFANGDQQLLESMCRNQKELVVCDFHSRNRAIDRAQQTTKIHAVLSGFNVKGQVAFKNPKIRYQLVQFHQWYQHHHLTPTSSTLHHVYFGMELCSNQIATAKFNNQYELNKRIYLGPTSTFNDLAFLMCNQALVKNGSIVIDPFVGTGGLLIPAATKGAFVFGSDLDIRVLNGYAVGRINKQSPHYKAEKKFQLFTPKINLNFQQYNLPVPNIIRIDSTKLTLKGQGLFDAIITDPPYGIRAMSRSVSKKVEKVKEQISEIAKELQTQTQTQTQTQVKPPLEIKQQPLAEKAKVQTHVPQEKQQEKKEVVDSDQDDEDEQIPEQQLAQLQLSDPKTFKKKKKDLTLEEQKQWRRAKRRTLKDQRRQRKAKMPEQEKQFKKAHMDKMNRQRTEQWEKYDKGKIETTEREKIFNSLLEFARKYLRQEGRLVFLYPVYEQEEYKGVLSLPQHEGFQLIDLSENKMSKGNSRILVTLKKL